MTTAATKIALLTLSIPAAAALAAERFVTTAGAYPAAGANADGVTCTAATAAGELVPVDVVGTSIVDQRHRCERHSWPQTFIRRFHRWTQIKPQQKEVSVRSTLLSDDHCQQC